MPLHTTRYQQLTEDEIEHIDQFLFRFAKLQDAIGEKLFVLILEFLEEENTRNKPFIDILNRLEQLNLLEDKNTWLELRKIRNNIAHQYEDEAQQASQALNAIYASKVILEKIYTSLRTSYLVTMDKI
jgi:DNA-binding ferritin-like protein (Dps family)